MSAAFLAFLAPQLSAEPKKLILQTSPEVVEIDLDGQVIIDAETGNLLATPTDPEACKAVGQDCGDVNVALQSFSVNNTQAPGSVVLSQGASAVFRWASRGAWDCAGMGMLGWSGENKPPSNSSGQSVNTSNLAPGTYDTTILCRNGPVEALSASLSVTISEETVSPGPVQCGDASRQPPSGWSRLSTGNQSCVWIAGVGFKNSADCRLWSGIFDLPFPGGAGNPQRFGIGRQSPNEYLAIQFSTQGFGLSGDVEILREGPGSNVSPTPLIATISECAGDFDRAAILSETGCYFVLGSSLDRIRIGGLQTTRDCKLAPDKTYYLNIVHSNSPAGTPANQLQSNCPNNTFCGWLYNPR